MMRIFQPDAYLTVDFHNHTCAVFRKGGGEMFPGVPNITKEEHCFEQTDALKCEIEAFLDSITWGTPPVVSGEYGRKALETALKIIKKL
jgi:hypothetical protein